MTIDSTIHVGDMIVIGGLVFSAAWWVIKKIYKTATAHSEQAEKMRTDFANHMKEDKRNFDMIYATLLRHQKMLEALGLHKPPFFKSDLGENK